MERGGPEATALWEAFLKNSQTKERDEGSYDDDQDEYPGFQQAKKYVAKKLRFFRNTSEC